MNNKLLATVLAVIGLCIVSNACSSEVSQRAQSEIYASTHNNLELVLEKYRATNNIPALAVAIVENGDIVFEAGFGHTYAANSIATSPSSIFRIASLTKLFTAQIILDLEAAGKLSIEDNISLYLPEIETSQKGECQITIRQLLTHHSGLKDLIWPREYGSHAQFNDYLTELIAKNQDAFFLAHKSLEFEYSDSGFNLLGEIIARLYQKPYSAVIREVIFSPKNMTQSQFYESTFQLNKIATAHKEGKPIPNEKLWPYDPNFFPSEGVISSVHDLALWMGSMMTEDSELQQLKPKLFSYQADTSWENTSIGLGWFINSQSKVEQVFHMGGLRGYKSILLMEPEAKKAYVVLSNTDDLDRWEILNLIRKSLTTPQ